MGLTETWICPEDSAAPAALANNFSFSHSPRQVDWGGGTGLLISNNCKYSTHSPLCNHNSFESHVITVTAPIKLLIVVIYRPPWKILGTFLEELNGLLSSFVEDGTPLLVFGDFNIHQHKPYATDFHSLLASFELELLTTTNTHKSGSQLDLIYTRNCVAASLWAVNSAGFGSGNGGYACLGHWEGRARWRPPPCPEPSRLDDWFLGVARAGSQGPNLVPFFSEVHYELTGTWMAPFPARDRSRVEWSVAMQLCPNTAFTWHGKPLLPSRACRHSSALTGSAYAACGEAASALHALALLQVHQAKALRDLHEGGHDPEVLSELRTATDLTLWATKYTAWSLGRAMSNMVVQEYHLWLCLANMREAGKVRFLECPRVPDWPLRRHGGKLRPAVLHCTKAVKAVDAPILRAEIAVLLEKDAIEPVPPADMRSGFYSPYFIVPKKGGGLRPILDLRILNRALHKLLFKMLMQKCIFGCVRPRYWFAVINLKDVYFHVSILPCHRPFLRFAFEGRQISTSPALRAVPIAPCLHESSRGSPCSLERRGHAHSQLPRRLAHTGSGSVMRTQALVLSHLSRLGLRVNWEKSKLSPMQRISFLFIELDSVNQTSVNQSIAQSVLNCLNTFESRTAAPLSTNSFRGSWGIWQLQQQSRR